MRVLLFERQPLLVEVLADLLARLSDNVDIVRVSDLAKLARQIEEDQDYALVFLGLTSSGEQVGKAIRRMLDATSPRKLIVFCDCTDHARVRRHVAEGVGGVLPRDADGDIVLAAARLVLAGGRYLPPEVFTPTSADLKNGNSSRDDDAFGLTPRQRNVLGLVAQGLSNKQVAYELSITEGTVKLHVNAILKTLGVSNRTSAALLARERPEIAQGPADDR